MVAVLQDHDDRVEHGDLGDRTDISVNGVPHQIDARRRSGSCSRSLRLRRCPTSVPPATPRCDNVLIVGAGSGSDVAIALSQGRRARRRRRHRPAASMQIGRRRNPDHPYDDPRVTRHINDGRAFLESTDKKYDLILFALPDSLALVTGASQIRLESFLFTEEALRGGPRPPHRPAASFAMYNYYREDWLIDRLAGTAAQRVRPHRRASTRSGGGQAVVTAALDEANQQCVRRRPTCLPGGDRAGHRRPAVPVLPGRPDPLDVPVGARRDPADLAARSSACSAGRSGRCGPTPTCSSWARRSCCWRPRTSRPSRCSSAPPGWSTRWCSRGVLLIVLAAVETTRRFRTPPLPVVFGLDRAVPGGVLPRETRRGC